MWHRHYAQGYNKNLEFYQDFIANVNPTSSNEVLVRYYHRCLYSLPKSSMLKALKKGRTHTFPGLMYNLVAKHLSDSSVTNKGHITHTRQGARFTISMRNAIVDARENVDDMNPNEEICHVMDDNNMFCYAVLVYNNENIIYSNLPGCFQSNHLAAATTSLWPTSTASMLFY